MGEELERARRGEGLSRRLLLVGGLGVVAGCSRKPAQAGPGRSAKGFAGLERDFGCRLGVHALDTGSGTEVGGRQDQRFLMCSTVKVFIVSAILARRLTEPGLLEERVRYAQSDLLEWSPVTEERQAAGMTVGELCGAAITRSDNTAANLLLARLGGPGGTQRFLRGLGDAVTRADRVEQELNRREGDKDTSTPRQLADNLRRLVLGNGLDPQGRALLVGWLRANTTGDQAIRAGVPGGWLVGDKTGSGFGGESNDIAVLWPSGRAPVVMAVLAAPDGPASAEAGPVIAEAARRALAGLGV